MHEGDDKRSLVSRKMLLGDEAATRAFGAALAAAVFGANRVIADAGLVIYLEGDLGTGKTTLVRGLLQSTGYAGKVKSPTYTFVEPYAISGLNLYHFDFYRFETADEFLDGGFDEYFGAGSLCLVEWPGKAEPHLPAADMCLALEIFGEGRKLEADAFTEGGRQCLNSLLMSTFSPVAGMSSGLPPPV